MKTNKFLTSTLFCALVAGLVACNSNNPTGGTTATQYFDLVKVCNSCRGKSVAEVQEIMKPYGLTSALDDSEQPEVYLRYWKYGEGNIPQLYIGCKFEDELCWQIEADQVFETREIGRRVYYENYFPVVYNETIDKLASDIMANEQDNIANYGCSLMLNTSAWDGDESPYPWGDDRCKWVQEFYLERRLDLGREFGWDYRNSNSWFLYGSGADDDEKHYVLWTTEQLFSQIKKDGNDFIALNKTSNSLQETEHEEYWYQVATSKTHDGWCTGWANNLYFSDEVYDDFTDKYYDDGYSISYYWDQSRERERDETDTDIDSSPAEAPLKSFQSGKCHTPCFSSFRK